MWGNVHKVRFHWHQWILDTRISRNILRWGHLRVRCTRLFPHSDAIMGPMASQTISFTIVYSTVYWDADQRKHQSFASLAFVLGIRRWPLNSQHKWSVTRKMCLFDSVIISTQIPQGFNNKIHLTIFYKRLFLIHCFGISFTFKPLICKPSQIWYYRRHFGVVKLEFRILPKSMRPMHHCCFECTKPGPG